MRGRIKGSLGDNLVVKIRVISLRQVAVTIGNQMQIRITCALRL